MSEPALPSITAVRMSGARNRTELPLLVLGPAAGTSAVTLWTRCAAHLADAFDVLAWDLPGHGHNQPAPATPFTVAELAGGVLAVVDDVLAERGELGGSFAYAGVGVGGAVGSQLQLDAPARINNLVLLGDTDPTEAPEQVGGLIRDHLLGAATRQDDDDVDVLSRLASALAAHVEAARADGVTAAEIRTVIREVEAALED